MHEVLHSMVWGGGGWWGVEGGWCGVEGVVWDGGGGGGGRQACVTSFVEINATKV